jgi:L-lactate dehydrogenase complex protein LldG
VAELQEILTRVRDALASHPKATNHAASAPVPLQPDGNRAELLSRFARELERVEGRTIGPITPEELPDRLVNLARERGVTSIAIGEGVAHDLSAVGRSLEFAGIAVVRAGAVDGETRAASRDRLARVDAGVAEADYGIASTGTLAVLSNAARPASLSLLPAVNFIVLGIERMKPDLAAALAALGPAAMEADRTTLITGPSRTADIEKRIVMGVHGPKTLDVVVVWPRDD